MVKTNCNYCGKEVERHPYYLRMHATTYCSPSCYASFRRKGSVDAKGYAVSSVDGKKRKHHRMIMEQHLGRTLLKNEVVHHINGDKTDNRLENLELVDHTEHSNNHNRIKWDIDLAASLLGTGLTLQQIANIVGVSRFCMTKQLKKRGLYDPQRYARNCKL